MLLMRLWNTIHQAARFGAFLLACDLLCLSSSSFCGQVSRIVMCAKEAHRISKISNIIRYNIPLIIHNKMTVCMTLGTETKQDMSNTNNTLSSYHAPNPRGELKSTSN